MEFCGAWVFGVLGNGKSLMGSGLKRRIQNSTFGEWYEVY